MRTKKIFCAVCAFFIFANFISAENSADEILATKNSANEILANKNSADEILATKNSATKNSTNENSADEILIAKNSANENFASGNSADEILLAENLATKNSANENSANKNSADEILANKNSADEILITKNSVTENSADENSATENSTNEILSAKNSATENSTNEILSAKNSATENSTNENSATKNSANEILSAKKLATENSADEILIAKNSTNKNSANEILIAKNSVTENSADEILIAKNSVTENSADEILIAKNSADEILATKNSATKNSTNENSADKNSSAGKSAFELNPVSDGIFFGAAATFALSAYIVEKKASFPEYDGRTYDLDDVNSFDRKFAKKYNRTLDNLGTVTCAINLALPFAIYGGSAIAGDFSSADFLTMLTMYAEAYLVDYGAKNFLKMGIKRVRPYMYFDDFPRDALDDYDFEFSSPSGHTTDSFLGAGFLTYTFCRYFPDSRLKIPVIASAYTVAATTAVLRVSSGNHFVSDTIFGAVLGTVCGIGVPVFHEFIAKKISAGDSQKKGDVKISVTPESFSFRFFF
jgi:undecaprenyl-diphosphatase